jgi:hypothetical protein
MTEWGIMFGVRRGIAEDRPWVMWPLARGNHRHGYSGIVMLNPGSDPDHTLAVDVIGCLHHHRTTVKARECAAQAIPGISILRVPD